MDVITIGESMLLFTPTTTGPLRYKSEFAAKIGGAESNVAIGLSRLGHKVGWISRLGNDEFGKKVLTFIRGEGVDVSHVILDPENHTGLYFKEMLRDHEVNVYYYRNKSAASFMKPSDLNKAYLAHAKYLHVTGITPILSETCCQTIMSAIDTAKKNGVQVVFDPNIRKKLWPKDDDFKKIFLEIAAKSDIVLPGIEEGKFLANDTNPEKISKFFHNIGASAVVLKLGEKGAYFSKEDEKGYVAPFPVKKVVDPIGAGDGFAAGFLSGLLDGLDMHKAVERGAAIGSIVTTVEGDVEGLPDRDQLYAFLSSTKREDVHR
jgi:2-dehydro-3-deoxygluconokinase